MHKWFLVYCKTRQEGRAEENLLRQGFDVFRPTIDIVESKIGRQITVKCKPLFPRYIFVKVDPEVKSIAPVLSTLGVCCFVKFGDRYAIAPESLIKDIRSNSASYSSLYIDRQSIKKGDDIYVDGHGFDQVKAIYCNPCGNTRATILMNILGNQSMLLVPNECISKAVG